MRLSSLPLLAAAVTMAAVGAWAQAPAAQNWATQDGTVALKDFKFGTGETLPELKLHYLTLGTLKRDAAGHAENAVLLLHGTGGSARSLLNPIFSNVLFVPGAPLDITKYFLIFPDDIGHGESSKPSEGLHARFPQYDYDDMVRGQRAMLEQMGVDHLRLILGTSMGCMQTFVWGETYAGFADALAPLACLPVEIAGRNRMMRWMAIEAIKQDPVWMGGEYKSEPVQGLRNAVELQFVMSSSPLQLQKQAPTRGAAEKYIDAWVKRVVASSDANDMIFYWNASRNYNPAPKLETITAPVLWINSADDYINPPELGIAEQMVKRMPRARFVLLSITEQTRGHGTHTAAAVWVNYLAEFMKGTEAKQ